MLRRFTGSYTVIMTDWFQLISSRHTENFWILGNLYLLLHSTFPTPQKAGEKTLRKVTCENIQNAHVQYQIVDPHHALLDH